MNKCSFEFNDLVHKTDLNDLEIKLMRFLSWLNEQITVHRSGRLAVNNDSNPTQAILIQNSDII